MVFFFRLWCFFVQEIILKGKQEKLKKVIFLPLTTKNGLPNALFAIASDVFSTNCCLIGFEFAACINSKKKQNSKKLK